MTESAVVDTGSLVAVISERDPNHERCTEALKGLRCPLVTSWPVLTEAIYLLRRRRQYSDALLQQAEEGTFFRVRNLDNEFAAWSRRFFDRFSDREPQLADASLVYLAEREAIETVFTIDVRDFTVYRTTDGKALRIVPE